MNIIISYTHKRYNNVEHRIYIESGAESTYPGNLDRVTFVSLVGELVMLADVVLYV